MKKLVIMLTALVTMTVSANAMSYEQARQQALFLTDKMAYELDLTEEQYEAAYEINLDYLMSVNSYDDLYGAYWTHRNLDMSYVLYDWQYTAYCAASYFFRPLYWDGGYWHFGIYARYPHRTYLYFGRPSFWVSYRGGHSWHHNGGRSWYHGRTFGPSHRPAREQHVGMRSTHRPDGPGHHAGGTNHHVGGSTHTNHAGTINHSYGHNSNRPGHGNNDTYRPAGGNRNNGTGRENGTTNRPSTQRESSTRTTATTADNGNRSDHSFGHGSRNNTSTGSAAGHSTPGRSFRPSDNSSRSSYGNNAGSRTSSHSSFGGSSSGSSRGFGSRPSSSSSRSSFGGGSGSRSFGGSTSGGGRSGGHSGGGGHGHFGGRR